MIYYHRIVKRSNIFIIAIYTFFSLELLSRIKTLDKNIIHLEYLQVIWIINSFFFRKLEL